VRVGVGAAGLSPHRLEQLLRPLCEEEGTVEPVQRPELVDRAVREVVDASLVGLRGVRVVGLDCAQARVEAHLAVHLDNGSSPSTVHLCLGCEGPSIAEPCSAWFVWREIHNCPTIHLSISILRCASSSAVA
jgi:hypothetical protein